jgi:phage terminase large subunit GpA-like protein
MFDSLNALNGEARAFAGSIFLGFAPPSDLKVSEWAEQHRIIARGNAEPGRWSNARAPYAVEPMDCLNDDTVHELIITGCSQSSKTSVGENIVGYLASCDPCTILWAGPSDDHAVNAGTRFDAMIQASPDLFKRFGSRSARSRINNQSLKEFEGGKLVLASAGSPTSLASHPARVVILDEIDRFPLNLKKEGDPVSIARRRSTTFARKKLIALSTPTVLGSSRIEALFDEGDRREWHWRCACGADHVPELENVKWDKDRPETAHYEMPCCGLSLTDAERWKFMQAGRWIATATGKPGVRSYRFRGLSSPWIRMADLASHFLAALGKPSLMQVFENTEVGLPFDAASGEGTDATVVQELAENYRGDVCPRDAALITAAIDVQGGWVFVGIVAWGMADEAWVLQLHQVNGDVKDPATWTKIEALLLQEFRHPSGATIPISAVACDAGFETQHVVEWSLKNRAKGRNWFAIKGQAGWERPIWQRGGDITRSMSKIFIVGIDQAKMQVMGGLATAESGPAKIHMRRDFHDEYFQWAVAEEIATSSTGKREWKLKRGERRNETLDVLVYNLAVKHSADFNVEQRLERLHSTGSLTKPQISMADIAKRMAAVMQP